MNEIIGYIILGIVICTIPITITILYNSYMYKPNGKTGIKPVQLFFLTLLLEVLYVLYVKIFK